MPDEDFHLADYARSRSHSSALRAVAVDCDRPEYGPTTTDRVRLLERRAKTDRVRVIRLFE